ncbi:hypothetical protein ACJJTC_014191 [Scirpophaga incertulas]
MYRATSHLLNFRTVLYGRPNVDSKTKKVSKYAPGQKYGFLVQREPCPLPPPPPPPPPKDDKLLWGALTALVLTGGFVYYAKTNPEVRDWLTIYAPWLDDFVAVMYQENMTYKQFGDQCINDLKCYIERYSSDVKPKECSLESGGALDKSSSKEEASKCDSKEEVKIKETKSIPPRIMQKTICEVDECVRDIGEAICNNYFTAKAACQYYNKLVEENMFDFKLSSFKVLHEAMAERLELVRTSTCNATSDIQQLEDLMRYLDCGVQAAKADIEAIVGLHNDYQDRISAERMLFQWENDKSIELDSQVIKVEELVKKYTDENQSLYSGLKYDGKKLELHGDPDILLYHTQRYAAKLQAEISEVSASMTERVNRAMSSLPQNETVRKARCALVQTEINKRKAALDQDYKQRFENQKANNEKTFKEALRSQLEKHEANLQTALARKENEMMGKIDKMVDEAVAVEKKNFARLLEEMAAELKKVEDKLNERLKAEHETRRSHDLWCAAEALLAATKKGEAIVRINKELAAIEKASYGDDKLVLAVLNSIPDSVRCKGLVPESVLRERYHRMEKVALAVSLVEADGGPMSVYILSWLQSLLLFMKLSCIPQSEIDKPPDEPSKNLDTFDLLQRARYYVEHGDLSRALSYVSALEGASASVASTWREAAGGYVAARLAADALRAHAAALGLRYL